MRQWPHCKSDLSTVSATANNALVKANNLSDLTNVTTARSNLGLGTFATASSLDLGSASATGIIADARLANQGGVVSGTQYTKVTVDGKGRVTSGAQLSSTDVTTALGFTPASASAATQWSTSGTSVYYNSGNVGVGIASPQRTLHVSGDGIQLTNSSIGEGVNDGFIINYVSNDVVFSNRKVGGMLRFGTNGFADKLTINDAGRVGIGLSTPVTKLDVSGGLRISMESATCAVSYAGTLRYNAGNVEFCNGTTWAAFGVATAGLTSLNGSTSQTQTFANGSAGNAPVFSTANGVHTLNIPLASATGSVTAGLISNADYVNFSNKITSSAASIAQVLGYTPASATALGNYLVKANNLSDLTSSATARTNLGLGAFATMSSLDLGSVSATGTLAVARLPAFAGDVSSTAGSNSLTVAGLRGISVSTTTPVSGQILTYNGSTWAPAAAGSSSQWTTSGTAISYSTGNVGIGTSTPATTLDVNGAATFRQAYFEKVGALGTLACGATNITGYSTNLYTLTACSSGTTILNIPTVTGWPAGSMSWTVTFFVTAQTASTFNVRYNNATTNVFWDKNSTGGAGGANYSGFLINDATTNVFTCTVLNTGSVAVYCGVSAQY